MTTQPEALRLANLIDSDFDPDWMAERGYDQIAAELRRLSAVEAQRDALLEACRMAMMLRHLGGMLPGSREIVEEIVKAAGAAIKKAEGNT